MKLYFDYIFVFVVICIFLIVIHVTEITESSQNVSFMVSLESLLFFVKLLVRECFQKLMSWLPACHFIYTNYVPRRLKLLWCLIFFAELLLNCKTVDFHLPFCTDFDVIKVLVREWFQKLMSWLPTCNFIYGVQLYTN